MIQFLEIVSSQKMYLYIGEKLFFIEDPETCWYDRVVMIYSVCKGCQGCFQQSNRQTDHQEGCLTPPENYIFFIDENCAALTNLATPEEQWFAGNGYLFKIKGLARNVPYSQTFLQNVEKLKQATEANDRSFIQIFPPQWTVQEEEKEESVRLFKKLFERFYIDSEKRQEEESQE